MTIATLGAEFMLDLIAVSFPYVKIGTAMNTMSAKSSIRRRSLSALAGGALLFSLVTPVLTAHADDNGWVKRDPSCSCQGIASSGDGSKLAGFVNGGKIVTSSDYGATWTAHETNRNWTGIASSADGTKLVATVEGGQIYTSADSGVTWTAHDSIRPWFGVASSADGTKLVAIVNPGQVYTSVDSGTTWTPRESSRAWRSVASSGDGT